MNRQVQPSEAPVRFRFENLGPVKDAEVELGSLTIIVGRNNTGKTYVAYTIYSFLKHFLLNRWGRMPRGSRYSKWVESLVADARTNGVYECRLSSEDIQSHRSELLCEYSGFFADALLAGTFSTRKDSFDRTKVSLQLPSSPSGIKDKMESLTQLSSQQDPRYPFQFDGTHLRIYPQIDYTEGMQYTFDLEYIADEYRRLLVPELPSAVSIFSAERFGVSLFYKELDFAKNQLIELLQKLSDRGYSGDDVLYLISDYASSRYTLPIKDNIKFTRSIADLRSDEAELFSEKLFERIETLMDGSYSASDDELRFQSLPHLKSRSNDSNFSIPIHLASSSARGLCDLYFFLKHQVRRNHLLIIDEPEGHLDTANQVQLARMLAHLVQAGVRILITTHSDYLLKEINNLIMLSRDFKDKESVQNSLGYSEEDFLDPALIRAYTAERGGLTSCEVDSLGIDFPVFDQVINTINRASIELTTRVDD